MAGAVEAPLRSGRLLAAQKQPAPVLDSVDLAEERLDDRLAASVGGAAFLRAQLAGHPLLQGCRLPDAPARRCGVPPDALIIDRAKIAEDARYDGKWVLRTSTELAAEEIALAYKSLWQAERLFRTVKGPLSWRPVHLWTEKRVRGHLVACFLVLVCEAELFHRLAAQQGQRPSYPEVVSDLKALAAIDLTIGQQRYLVRTELRPHAHTAFRAVGPRPPPRVQPLGTSA